MRIGFAGTPDFASTILQALLDQQTPVVRVLTQPGRPAGRKSQIRPSSVQQLAERYNIEVQTPERLTREQVALVDDLDMLVVAAYGLLLPSFILNAPKWGCLNAHASLLPRWRGAAPIEYALMHGDSITGISIMQITKGLDAGPVLLRKEISIEDFDTTSSLTAKLATLGGEAMCHVLADYAAGNIPIAEPQDPRLATKSPRLSTKQARIDWRQDAVSLERQVRAFQGRGGAYATLGDVRIKIHQANVVGGEFTPGVVYTDNHGVKVGCRTGSLNLNRLQLNRGKGSILSATDARNGYAEVFSNGTQWDL